MGGYRATYTVHLRLIRNLVVDFLFVLIELFALGVTAEVQGGICAVNQWVRRLI